MNDNPLNFSNLNQTWTKKSSLELGSYDAYPELESNANYNKSFNMEENYTSYGSYGQQQRPISLQYSVYSLKQPLNKVQNIRSFPQGKSEKFSDYDNLKKTWTIQTPFKL